MPKALLVTGMLLRVETVYYIQIARPHFLFIDQLIREQGGEKMVLTCQGFITFSFLFDTLLHEFL